MDIYVILHRQSDPSCTYLETLSCGIPIIGYKNKAFSGLLDLQNIGWGVAKKIEHLSSHRDEIKEKSRQSISFAKNHDFDTTFMRRIDHLKSLI
ncbi:MAG: colanic acid/amylovoran biosynthesis glycosyltransferase [Cellvibrionaceae bacterium]